MLSFFVPCRDDGDWADRVVEKLAAERAAELGIETFVFDRTGAMIYA